MMAPAIESFADSQGSYAVIGNSGHGKTTAIECLVRHADKQSLILPYPPIGWPNAGRPKVPGENHIAQIMAIAATEIASCLKQTSYMAAAVTLNPLQHEYLCWLMEKYLGHRTLVRLGYRINKDTQSEFTLPKKERGLNNLSVSSERVAFAWLASRVLNLAFCATNFFIPKQCLYNHDKTQLNQACMSEVKF
ncbi:MAG: hypothetical protein GY796_29725 [Chloroflexi bacterium]|nr:hypothetical protein [Chloroflexota bacterium]